MAVQRLHFYTEQEYLDLERESEYKSEYVNGQIYAMAGGSREHNLVAGNAYSELRARLHGRPCETYINDVRLRVSPTGMYTYPDVMVVCEGPEFADGRRDTVTNPLLIVEVLSPSTALYDRGEKFAHYRRLESLREYVLVEQDRCRVERYVRNPANAEEWVLTEFSDPQGDLPFASLDVSIPLAEVYARVEFPVDAPAREATPPRTD